MMKAGKVLGALAVASLLIAGSATGVEARPHPPDVPTVPHDPNAPNVPNAPDPNAPNVPNAPNNAPNPTPAPTPTPTPGDDQCHATSDGRPDPTCTPGVISADVTQANIGTTICTKGFASKVRPDSGYTESLKKQQMKEYGYTGPISGRAGKYEEDHFLPIELGGSPTDSRNLWPEKGGLPTPNHKDKVEDAANKAVCSSKMPLASAQQAMVENWVQLGAQLHVN
jgi:hypothetical protein